MSKAAAASLLLIVACSSCRVTETDPLMTVVTRTLIADIHHDENSGAQNEGPQRAWLISIQGVDSVSARAFARTLLRSVGGRRSLASDTVAEKLEVYDVTQHDTLATVGVNRGGLFCEAGTPTGAGTSMTYNFRRHNGTWLFVSRTDEISYDRAIPPATPASSDECARAFAGRPNR